MGKGLNPGESELKLTVEDRRMLRLILTLDRERGRWGHTGRYLLRKLDGRERVVLTRDERELLHFVLADALVSPEFYGAERGTNACRIFTTIVIRVRNALPRRGAGTY